MAPHNVYALDAATGEERWRFKTGDWVSSAAVVSGVVYVGSSDNHVYALDAATGGQCYNGSDDRRTWLWGGRTPSVSGALTR